ncbi:MAG: hypothetical protein IT371_24605 [Deltaproteobacteria bacterium]|nr:hypothetical protein [Deltaproteobacteria bacterium]
MNPPAAETFQDWKLVLLSPWGTAMVVFAAAVALAALALSAWGFRRVARRRARLLLLALRGLALAAALVMVLQPAIQLRSVTRVPNHVALLVDLSGSMALRDEQKGPARVERAQALLERSRPQLAAWERKRRVDRYAFGADLRVLPGADGTGLVARDPATRIGEALTELRKRYHGVDLAGVVLVSDGIDNGRLGSGRLSPEGRQIVKRLGAPVHAVWVGRGEIVDLSVAELHADGFAFVRNAVTVEADLAVSGLAVTEVPLRLELGGEVVAERRVRLERGRERYRVKFEFVPQRVGKYVLSVSAPVYPGEALATNNRRSALLNVIRDRIRVLQVCGRPSWDQRFLRRLLKRDPNVDLISFFILRTPASLALVPSSELSLIPFPTEELFEKELGSFDLVILQNFNYGPYGIGVYLPQLRQYVERGGGLAMLGGDLSFTAGGYADTPLAEVLPVRLLPPELAADRLVSTEDFRMRLTAEGKDHPILQLARSREETEQLLAVSPALAGVNKVAGLASGATALATHPALKATDGQPMPVLATREVGQGRTLALTTDSLWHWAFLSVGQGGTRQAYDRFWRNAIRWLMQDPELKYLRVIFQRDTIALGQTLKATVRAYQPDYRPAKGLKVRYELGPVSSGKTTAKEAVTDAEGEVRLEYRPEAVGAYRLSARARIGGRDTSEEALALVDAAGPEEREPRARPELLRELAAATGGRFLEQADRLPDLPFLEPRVLHVNWRKDLELWSRPWWLAGTLFLLALEWFVRRRYGFL